MLIEASGADCKACCSEKGMFSLRERRMHVSQEDFEIAVTKFIKKMTAKTNSKKFGNKIIFIYLNSCLIYKLINN